MKNVVVLALALLLAACAQTPQPPEVRYVTVAAPPVKPVIARECFAANPAEPYLASGRSGDIITYMKGTKLERVSYRRLRRVCRASLVSQFGDPGR